jgi:hypothetical protein
MTNDQAPMTNQKETNASIVGHWDLVIGHSLAAVAFTT